MDDSPQQEIRRQLAAYLTDPAAEHRDVAIRFEALPVYSDIGGTLFITPSLRLTGIRCGTCFGLGWPALHSNKILPDDARLSTGVRDHMGNILLGLLCGAVLYGFWPSNPGSLLVAGLSAGIT